MSFLCTVELSATGPRPPQAGSGCVQRIYISSDPPVDAKRAKCGSKQLPENTVEGTRTTLGRTSRTPRPATRVHNRHHAHASCPRTAQSHMHRQPVTGRRQTRLTVPFSRSLTVVGPATCGRRHGLGHVGIFGSPKW